VSVVSRPSRRQAGVIRMRVVRGSAARTLSLRLSEAQYQLAAAAVTDSALLRIVGRQEKEGSRYWLYEPTDIRVIEAPPTAALPNRAEQLSVDLPLCGAVVRRAHQEPGPGPPVLSAACGVVLGGKSGDSLDAGARVPLQGTKAGMPGLRH